EAHGANVHPFQPLDLDVDVGQVAHDQVARALDAVAGRPLGREAQRTEELGGGTLAHRALPTAVDALGHAACSLAVSAGSPPRAHHNASAAALQHAPTGHASINVP